jgi:hypothetical protein
MTNFVLSSDDRINKITELGRIAIYNGILNLGLKGG